MTRATRTPQLVLMVVFSLVILTFAVADFYRILPQSVVTLLVLLLTWRRLAPIWESPALAFSVFMFFNAVFGYTFSNFLSAYGGTAGADTALSDALRLSTANVFFLAATLVPITACALSGRPAPTHDLVRTYQPISSRANAWGLALATAVLIALATLQGLPWLLMRGARFTGDTGGATSLLLLLGVASCVFLGSAIASRSTAARVFGWALIAGYALLYIALASRSLALLPLLVLAGAGLLGAKRLGWRSILAASTLAVLLLPIPLLLRSGSDHGLLPYIDILASTKFSLEDYLTSANNVLNGFGIVGTTAFRVQPITPEQLAVSLSPLTGDAAGWYEIASGLRLNFYTPYAALGELANVGWATFTISMLVLGLAFGIIERAARRIARTPRVAVLRFLPIGLCYLFTIQMTQYNLRSEARLVYYAIIAALVLSIIARLLPERRSVSTASSERLQQARFGSTRPPHAPDRRSGVGR